MGDSAEGRWQTIRMNTRRRLAEPEGLSQRCADGDRTQPNSSVPSSFRQYFYTKPLTPLHFAASRAH